MVSTENKGRETGTVLSRTLTCSIRGSLNQFAHGGQEAACWSTQNGRINDILGVTELLDGAADQASAAALIKTAYLHKVTVLEYLNGFPLPLGVSISCVPSRECTRTGVAYAFSTLDDDVFYLFLQKQNLGAKLHIYLEEGTYPKRLFRGPSTNDMKK